jgi:UV excision repair protein RAD23
MAADRIVSGPALQSAIASMTEMGFDKDLVQRAMKASYNNPDRAVEYLMSVSLSHPGENVADSQGDIPETEGLGRPAGGAAPAPVCQTRTGGSTCADF